MSVTTKIQISGMTCASCTNSITKELQKIPGVFSVTVSLLTEEAVISHTQEVSTHLLLESIEDLGFDGVLISSVLTENANDNSRPGSTESMDSCLTRIHVGGMTCSSCSNSITSSLLKIPGVERADVSLLTEEATIVHKNIDPTELVECIDDMGFEAALMSSKAENQESRKESRFKTELTISGMTCAACVSSITNTLNKLKGIENVDLSLMTKTAVIIHDDEITVDLIKETIEDMGFDVAIVQVTDLGHINNSSCDIATTNLKIYGLSSLPDVELFSSHLNHLEGIIDCNINLTTENVTLNYDSNVIGIRKIINEINTFGFDAILTNRLDSTSQIDLLSKVKEFQYWRNNFFNLLKFGIPIFFLSHIYPLIRSGFHLTESTLRIGRGLYLDILLQCILGSYVQFALGQKYYINCYKSLRHGAGSMDVLICISTSIVYVYSLFSIIHGIFTNSYPNVLYDTSTMLFTFVSIGKWVESKAKGNTSTALSKLLSLTPTTCIMVENPEVFSNNSDDKFSTLDTSSISQKQISIDLLQKGDILIVLPGSKVPTDGECIFGSSESDEALLTGESAPVEKHVGSSLIGGSVNLTSTIFMKVTKIGEETQLQQIVKLVKEAQISSAPVQRYADLIASIFVPSILIFSLVTLIFWCCYVNIVHIDSIPKMFLDSTNSDNIAYFKILQVAISVIVVACPCALGLAAPTAVMVGTGVGALNGMLIKGGEILEKASQIDTVIFDKTGTLTKGVMEVSNYEFLGEYKQRASFVWSLVNAIESNSEHPVAKALVVGSLKHLSDQKPYPFQFSTVETFAGLGILVSCTDPKDNNAMNVKLGNAKFLKTSNIKNPNDFDSMIYKSRNIKIGSICHILINDEYVGYIELSDTLKSDSKTTIETFIKYGYSVGMVTGDSIETSKHVAALLGIPLNNVLAGANPEQKLEYIKELQDLGMKVAFVGDGINDAPALVQSDTGIAISSGTDIAMSAADIVLLSSSSSDSSLATDSNSHIGLLGVFASFDISKCTFHTIKVNFLLAIIYNMIMLPISMGLLIIPFSITMHPMFASAAMACSSTSVVLNSLSLKKWSMEKLKKNISRRLEDKSYNLGMHDGIADNRSDIDELSVNSFIVNSFNSRKSIPFPVRLYEKIIRSFRRRTSNNSYHELSNVDF